MLVPSLWVFNYIQKRYRAVSREVKRLESIYSAVVLTHLSETKKGLKVLRASDKEKFMIDEYLEKVNHILAIRCVIDSVIFPSKIYF